MKVRLIKDSCGRRVGDILDVSSRAAQNLIKRKKAKVVVVKKAEVVNQEEFKKSEVETKK